MKSQYNLQTENRVHFSKIRICDTYYDVKIEAYSLSGPWESPDMEIKIKEASSNFSSKCWPCEVFRKFSQNVCHKVAAKQN